MILAIDPGSEKTGTAVLGTDGSLVCRQIIPTGDLFCHLREMYKKYAFTHIVMGNGTNHRHLQPVAEEWIRKEAPDVTFSLIDEKFTTVEGRKLYWQYTPRHGWRRLVPLSLQYPPEPVDDFVAWIIGQRYIKSLGGLS